VNSYVFDHVSESMTDENMYELKMNVVKSQDRSCHRLVEITDKI